MTYKRRVYIQMHTCICYMESQYILVNYEKTDKMLKQWNNDTFTTGPLTYRITLLFEQCAHSFRPT